MRRVFSVLLFIVGGWLLAGEMMIAFLDMKLGAVANLTALGIVLLFVLPFLLIGTWVSPGDRRREVGLTLLITVGSAVVCGASALLVLSDPAMKQFLPPQPPIGFALLAGVVNLLLIGGAGVWLYRGVRRGVA